MKRATPRILQVAAPAQSGGLETVLAELSEGLHLAGHNVRVALVIDSSSKIALPLHDRLVESGVTVDVLRVGVRQYAMERELVRRVAESMDADVIHTHGYRADVLHGATARVGGRSHVMTLHGFVSLSWRDRVYEYLQLRAARRASAAIAVSTPIEQRLKQFKVRNVHLIQNASIRQLKPLSREDAREKLGIARKDYVVGFVGRLSVEKAPDIFIKALATTPHQVKAVIIGDGPMMDSLIALRDHLRLSDRLRFAGMIPNASRLFTAFDAIVLTSRTEGTPMVLLEAALYGIPIVSTNVGGVPELLSREQALFCPPESPDRVSAAIVSLLDSEELAKRISENAMLSVTRRFQPAQWIAKHVELYQEVSRERPTLR